MYFRIDDKLHSHVKAMRAGTEAMGLWALAASWSASQLTDGWVPEYAALRIAPNAPELANRLVTAGLWHVDTREGEAGWVFHEWDEWQHTREYVQERQARARERMRKARETKDDRANSVRANSARSAHNPKPNPNPKKDTPAAADASADFDRFWTLYPRKVGKQAAAKAFTKALRSTDVATIAAGLRNATAVWTATGTEARFIPHPATWLNEGRWADEQPVLPATEQVTTQHSPAATLAQCADTTPHSRHQWQDGRNRCVCMGVAA